MFPAETARSIHGQQHLLQRVRRLHLLQIRRRRQGPTDPDPPRSGTRLLRALGVEPQISDEDFAGHTRLRQEFAGAVADLEGHALALPLAGNYVVAHRDSQLKAIHDIPQLEQADYVDENYRSPFRVFRTVELALLRRMGEHAADSKDPFDNSAARQVGVALLPRPLRPPRLHQAAG